MMSFSESVKTCMIKKYATMSGRASRSEFWWFQLFLWVTHFCIIAITSALGKEAENVGNAILIIFSLATIIPYLCAFVRRLHDRGHSGSIFWWSLLISIFGVLLIGLIINIFGSDEGENEYGPNPNNPCVDDSLLIPETENFQKSLAKEEQTEDVTDVDL